MPAGLIDLVGFTPTVSEHVVPHLQQFRLLRCVPSSFFFEDGVLSFNPPGVAGRFATGYYFITVFELQRFYVASWSCRFG